MPTTAARSTSAGTVQLGFMFQARGELPAAETTYRRADEWSSPKGATNLGVPLQQRGDLAGAEAAYQRADERGTWRER